MKAQTVQENLDRFLDSATELVASPDGQDQEDARRLLLKASVSLLLLQTLFGSIDDEDAEMLRNVYAQMIGDENGE